MQLPINTFDGGFLAIAIIQIRKIMTTENLPQLQSNSIMPSAQEFQMLQVIAKNAQDSGLYAGMGQQSKIFMVLLAARELGVSPMLALNGGIWNIQGKIEISARLMNGLIRRAGHSIKIIVSNDTHCTLLGTRTDGDSFECSFNMEDAIKAGLAGGNVWKKYPADMLYNRCMSRLARRLFSDVIGNAYVEGEIKEAKEIERLEQAECEDITCNKGNVLCLNQENKNSTDENDTKMDHIKDDTNLKQNPAEIISFDQLTEIMKKFVLMSDVSQKNFNEKVLPRWGVTEMEHLPAEAYQIVMNSIESNLKLNAGKV